MIAPVAAPIPAPPNVPSSRVDIGSPEHPATRKSAASASAPVTIACLRMVVARLLFGFAVTLQLLNLLLLILNLPLLIVDLRLSLSLLILPILHLVADCVSAQCADTAADCRARERVADRRADNRARCRADAGSDEGAFLTSREGLSRASHRHHERNRHEQAFDQRHRNRICPHGLSPFNREQFSCLLTAEDFLEPGSRLVYLAADSFLPYT